MITNEESTEMKRLTAVMRDTPSGICHTVRNKNGIAGVKFDRGIYKGKFMPLHTDFDIRHLEICIDRILYDINPAGFKHEEVYNDDVTNNLFTDEPGDIEVDDSDTPKYDVNKKDCEKDASSDNDVPKYSASDDDEHALLSDFIHDYGENEYDPIIGLPLPYEECKKSTRKIIDKHGYSKYFDYITTPNGNFCGVVFWDPHKPIKETTDERKKVLLRAELRPQVIKFNDPYTEEVDEYFDKLSQCIDIIKEFDDDVDDFVVYVKRCMEKEDTGDYDPKNEVDKEKIQEFIKKSLLPIIDHILSCGK
jgi:hypothetical protein